MQKKRKSTYLMWRVKLLCNQLILIGMGVFLHGSAAAQLVIGPTVIEFGPKQKVASVSVTLDKNAAGPMRLQTEVLRWHQTVKGEDVYTATNELLVTPPITEINPGQKQTFRLALRGARTTPDEIAYRLILEDVSAAVNSAQVASNMKIDFKMRYDLPVMIAPAGSVVNRVIWKPCALDSTISARPAGPCIHLRNTGNRRVKVKTLILAGDGWEQSRAFGAGENILAGAEREWVVPLKTGQPYSIRSVQAQTAHGETLMLEPGDF